MENKSDSNIEELLLELEKAQKPSQDTFLKVIKACEEQGHWDLEPGSFLFRAHKAHILKGGKLSENEYDEAKSTAWTICRSYDANYPPELDNECAWEWFIIRAHLYLQTDEILSAYQDAALVLRFREDYRNSLRSIVEHPGYVAWSEQSSGLFPWTVDEAGKLSLSLPKTGKAIYTHMIASTMEINDIITAAPHNYDSPDSYPTVQHYLEKLDIKKFLEHTQAKGPCDKPWKSSLEDPNEALGLLLAQFRKDGLEQIHNALAKAFVESFEKINFPQLLEPSSHWFAQSLVSMRNDGKSAINTLWLEAFQEALRIHSERHGGPIVTISILEGDEPYGAGSAAFSVIRESRRFDFAVSYTGSLGVSVTEDV